MAVKVKAGSFTLNTGTGNQVISDVGFEPQGIVVWAARVTSESAAVDAMLSYGMSDGTNTKVGLVSAEDGSGLTDRTQDDSEIINLVNPANGTLVVVCTVVSLDSGGFTINVGTNSSSEAILVKYWAIGGVDNLVVGQVLASASPVTGLGFQPNLLLAQSSGQAAGDVASQHAINSPFGCAERFGGTTRQWCMLDYKGEDDRLQTCAQIRSDSFTGQFYNAAATWTASLTTFDAGGFTWSGTNADVFWYMAIELPSGIEAFAASFQKSTGAAPATQALPDSTFVPQGYILATEGNPNAQTDVAQRSPLQSVGGYSGGTDIFNVSNSVELGTGNQADMISDNDEVLREFAVGGTTSSSATPQTIADSTPDIEWNPNSANAIWCGYLAFEKDGVVIVVDETENISETDLHVTQIVKIAEGKTKFQGSG